MFPHHHHHHHLENISYSTDQKVLVFAQRHCITDHEMRPNASTLSPEIRTETGHTQPREVVWVGRGGTNIQFGVQYLINKHLNKCTLLI